MPHIWLREYNCPVSKLTTTFSLGKNAGTSHGKKTEEGKR